ncbi:hypothetical protein Aca07nite_58090 [Actinoplanes capillaceus]|uniref:RepA protein n=1 Tax=Actinoplanes campanulatus TaxID=113559 RepID=A0ABQ3WQK0_9ACTN|nr:replication protein RepA [Actinoplanes capillaceus]GID48534.1 hypothetical protein Aca07nite_58090 [Actinoplanes capillaceus]
MSFSFRHGDVAVHITVEPETGAHGGCRLPGSAGSSGETILYPPLHADLVLPDTDPGDSELHYRPGLGSWRSGLSEGEFARYAGVPYGLLGRHLVMFLCTEAFRCRSRTITFQPHRLYAFLAGLGSLSESTVRGGWFTELEDQLHRTLRHGWVNEGTGGSGFLVSGRSRQTHGFLDSSSECPPVITLEAEFAKSALRWIPLDADTVRTLGRHSCLALDVYIWLTLVGTYLDDARQFPWPSLLARFGAAGEDQAAFRSRFEACLNDIRRVTPLPPVTADTPGIEIRPASSCVGSFHRAWPLPRPVQA